MLNNSHDGDIVKYIFLYTEKYHYIKKWLKIYFLLSIF